MTVLRRVFRGLETAAVGHKQATKYMVAVPGVSRGPEIA